MQPLKRRELSILQKKLSPVSLDDELARFLSFLATELSLNNDEITAMNALASFARDKLDETLNVIAETMDLRFLDGVLVEA